MIAGEEEAYDWEIFWGDINCFIADNGFQHGKMVESQRINHFPRNYELCRKDLMAKNLKRMKRNAAKTGGDVDAWDFFPQTYTLPIDWGLFVEEHKARGGVWIAKPVGRAQGKGIFLLNKVSQLAEFKTRQEDRSHLDGYIVQRYIERPLLIGMRKFDLRLYCLVTSFRPLTAYLHRGGFARFSSESYKLNKHTLDDIDKHLTNAAITKKSSNYVEQTGNKWSVGSFRSWALSNLGQERTLTLFAGIQNVIYKSLLACQEMVVQDRHCFELYGYDIMIDADLRPLLIEVNAQPSLSADTDMDRELKLTVVSDSLDVLEYDATKTSDMPALTSMGGLDAFVINDEPVKRNTPFKSFLGCHYERHKNAHVKPRPPRSATG